MSQHILSLPGCTPEPLMNYLKALGILRIVSEQAGPNARGCWKNGVFELYSKFDRDGLIQFLLHDYEPSPVVVPWSGNDFFAECDAAGPFAATPTAKAVIAAFRETTSKRLTPYREAIKAIQSAMQVTGVLKKADIEKKANERVKANFLTTIRNIAPDSVACWIDAAALISGNRATFSSLLGSGGGSDGNTHFSDNFMQNLWDCLPDFNIQRGYSVELGGKKWVGLKAPASIPGKLAVDQTPKKTTLVSNLAVEELLMVIVEMNPNWTTGQKDELRKRLATLNPVHCIDKSALFNALFGEHTKSLIAGRTSALFDSGAVGGPNASQGFERESLINPWNFILGIEGTLCFSGALVKRLNADAFGTFPFQFQLSVTGRDSASSKEQSGRELWLPLWNHKATFSEVAYLLAEGRAERSQQAVRRGVDMMQAVAQLGIDRGINEFARYAIVRGRVGGDNYNTAACLGRVVVRDKELPGARLIEKVSGWIDTFRDQCKTGQKEEAPHRFGAAARRIDAAIFDYCRYGGKVQFNSILCAHGQAESEVAKGETFWDDRSTGSTKVRPLTGLSSKWIEEANDCSPEFRLALSLAAMFAREQKVGPLRANLEPFDLSRGKYADWDTKDRRVVWNAADLTSNLSSILARRLVDGTRLGCAQLPLESAYTAPLDAVAAFLDDDGDRPLLDFERIEELLWGLILIDHSTDRIWFGDPDPIAPLPRAYALLKLLFLPAPLVLDRTANGSVRGVTFCREGQEGLTIKPEPQIIPLLQSGRRESIGEACRIAARRLRASGINSLPHRTSGGRNRDAEWEEVGSGLDGRRLAAALLFPITPRSIASLFHLVARPDSDSSDVDDAKFVSSSLS